MNSFEKSVLRLLGELSPRARSVIKQRYGLGQKECLTLEAIGKKEGITRERVRQIENDALTRLKKSPVLLELASVKDFMVEAIKRRGGIVSETTLLSAPEFTPVKDKNYLVLFFDLISDISKRKETDAFFVRWHTRDTRPESIEHAVAALAEELSKNKTTFPEPEMHKKLTAYSKQNGAEVHSHDMLRSYLALSKEISKNVWGEYGHVGSPFIRPRGMRDGAYVVLTRAKEPLHFREISRRISEFSTRHVHVQTVHNELIKDERFVLVGRGLYALHEWGYEPGFIKDVLVKLLRDRGALTKEEIVEETLKRRQVKAGTIVINLQNRHLFKPQDDGTFTLVS